MSDTLKAYFLKNTDAYPCDAHGKPGYRYRTGTVFKYNEAGKAVPDKPIWGECDPVTQQMLDTLKPLAEKKATETAIIGYDASQDVVPDYSNTSIKQNTSGFNAPDFQINPLWLALGVAGGAVGAYHGYRRNDSVMWAIVWSTLGGIAPIIVIPVALAQGIGKRKVK